MKLQASTQNVFAFRPALPLVGAWEKETPRRAGFTIRPFGSEETQPSVSQRDELARKQEIICAVILGLCLLFTVLVCLGQLAAFL